MTIELSGDCEDHERDEWLISQRQAVDSKIRAGLEELERGEGIPESELDDHLQRLKDRAVSLG